MVLSRNEIELEPFDYWTSARTGARYPTHWRLRIPDRDIELDLIPDWIDQEGIVWSPFWAGPVRLGGRSSTVSGDGLMQLNGYGEP